MSDKVLLKSAAIIGETAKARRVQADVRVGCAGGDQHLSMSFWAPAWAVEDDDGVRVDAGVLAEKEEDDLRREAVKRGCADVHTVEVLTA